MAYSYEGRLIKPSIKHPQSPAGLLGFVEGMTKDRNVKYVHATQASKTAG